ncbi:MAG: aminotransferase class I/II-fold pyridoxal phosphate-dependent enzyme, partial [Woeseiaceae bacterium]
KFEQQFATYAGSRFCVMVNSGSSANLLAIAALSLRSVNPLRPGDEVIVPAVSWSTTYYPLHQYGLKLRFVDIDGETLNLDLDQLETAINDRTRLVAAVNLLGNPLDYARLSGIIGDRPITVFEDNCESLGATLGGKQAGTFGAIGTYSSFFSHHISTMEGGMAVTDDEELYHLMLSVRAHGWTRDLPRENRVCVKSDDHFSESFRFVLPGYNLRPLEMSGALGQEQLLKLPDIVRSRRTNAMEFQALFANKHGISIQSETGESSWFGFAFVLDEKIHKRKDVLDMLASRGVETRPVVAGNFVRNPVVKYFDYVVHRELQQADRITDHGFFIGNHHYDIRPQLRELATLF